MQKARKEGEEGVLELTSNQQEEMEQLATAGVRLSNGLYTVSGAVGNDGVERRTIKRERERAKNDDAKVSINICIMACVCSALYCCTYVLWCRSDGRTSGWDGIDRFCSMLLLRLSSFYTFH